MSEYLESQAKLAEILGAELGRDRDLFADRVRERKKAEEGHTVE